MKVLRIRSEGKRNRRVELALKINQLINLLIGRGEYMKTKPFYALALVTALSACATPPGVPSLAGSAAQTEVCKVATEKEIAGLFDRWNEALVSGDVKKVVANYATRSILLPTVSNKPRLTPEEKEDYFQHFLENRPSGKIDMRYIEVGCNSALDAGLYTFIFAKTGQHVSGRYSYTYHWDGKDWLITSHHSSMMPEKASPARGKKTH